MTDQDSAANGGFVIADRYRRLFAAHIRHARHA